MNEIITAGGVKYTATNISTGINTITFTLLGLAEDEAKAAFRHAESLPIGDEDTAYGKYPDVKFESLTIGADEKITITMHILNNTEKQIRDLQVSQAEQDEAIAELLYGGGEA